jgi:hypothetical protein
MRILGVDPGTCGAVAVIELDDGAAPRLVEAIDIPTVGTGAKERVDVLALRAWIQRHRPDRATGALEAVLACCEVPLELVEPSVWKRARHLRGGDKEGARQLALQMFPAQHVVFARKRDHQCAEAVLIALHVSGRTV